MTTEKESCPAPPRPLMVFTPIKVLIFCAEAPIILPIRGRMEHDMNSHRLPKTEGVLEKSSHDHHAGYLDSLSERRPKRAIPTVKPVV